MSKVIRMQSETKINNFVSNYKNNPMGEIPEGCFYEIASFCLDRIFHDPKLI